MAKPRPSAEAGTVPGSSQSTLTSEVPMSTINHEAVARRLTRERLRTYLAASDGDLERALALYDWNARVGGALHEDIGRLEVVFRNAIDEALLVYGAAQGWPTAWYQRRELFPGKHGARALDDIKTARVRATRRGVAEVHGKVIAELSFGFWRFLCTTPYLTSLWVPALGDAFPNHPDHGDPRAVRQAVDDRIQRVHFLRNRVAHYEPVHHRNLRRDLESITQLTGWISADTQAWIVGASRTARVIKDHPNSGEYDLRTPRPSPPGLPR